MSGSESEMDTSGDRQVAVKLEADEIAAAMVTAFVRPGEPGPTTTTTEAPITSVTTSATTAPSSSAPEVTVTTALPVTTALAIKTEAPTIDVAAVVAPQPGRCCLADHQANVCLRFAMNYIVPKVMNQWVRHTQNWTHDMYVDASPYPDGDGTVLVGTPPNARRACMKCQHYTLACCRHDICLRCAWVLGFDLCLTPESRRRCGFCKNRQEEDLTQRAAKIAVILPLPNAFSGSTCNKRTSFDVLRKEAQKQKGMIPSTLLTAVRRRLRSHSRAMTPIPQPAVLPPSDRDETDEDISSLVTTQQPPPLPSQSLITSFIQRRPGGAQSTKEEQAAPDHEGDRCLWDYDTLFVECTGKDGIGVLYDYQEVIDFIHEPRVSSEERLSRLQLVDRVRAEISYTANTMGLIADTRLISLYTLEGALTLYTWGIDASQDDLGLEIDSFLCQLAQKLPRSTTSATQVHERLKFHRERLFKTGRYCTMAAKVHPLCTIKRKHRKRPASVMQEGTPFIQIGTPPQASIAQDDYSSESSHEASPPRGQTPVLGVVTFPGMPTGAIKSEPDSTPAVTPVSTVPPAPVSQVVIAPTAVRPRSVMSAVSTPQRHAGASATSRSVTPVSPVPRATSTAPGIPTRELRYSPEDGLVITEALRALAVYEPATEDGRVDPVTGRPRFPSAAAMARRRVPEILPIDVATIAAYQAREIEMAEQMANDYADDDTEPPPVTVSAEQPADVGIFTRYDESLLGLEPRTLREDPSTDVTDGGLLHRIPTYDIEMRRMESNSNVVAHGLSAALQLTDLAREQFRDQRVWRGIVRSLEVCVAPNNDSNLTAIAIRRRGTLPAGMTRAQQLERMSLRSLGAPSLHEAAPTGQPVTAASPGSGSATRGDDGSGDSTTAGGQAARSQSSSSEKSSDDMSQGVPFSSESGDASA